MKQTETYPLVIIGSGIAGLAASIYASRYQIKHLIIGDIPGGLMSESVLVENFPGFKSISGYDLAKKIEEQVKHYKPAWEHGEVIEIKKEEDKFVIKTKSGKEFFAQYLILSTGTKRRKLGVPGEKELTGKGIHYCATCDSYFYKDKKVLIVGGGDAGVTAAIAISKIAKKVVILNDLPFLTAMPFWPKKLKDRSNIELILANGVESFVGNNFLEKVNLEKAYQGKKNLTVNGVFIEIGSVPNTDLAKSLKLDLDEKGFVKVKEDQKTSNNNIYAAGDASSGSNHFHQMLTAAAEGAIAVNAIYQELHKK